MNIESWLNRLRKNKPVTEEDKILARQNYGQMFDLERSPGWEQIKIIVLRQAHEDMTEICEQGEERRRDFLGARIQTLDWFLKLPRQKMSGYGSILEEEPDDPAPEPDRDYLCPTPGMEQDERDED